MSDNTALKFFGILVVSTILIWVGLGWLGAALGIGGYLWTFYKSAVEKS
jgi:hypothetical protein